MRITRHTLPYQFSSVFARITSVWRAIVLERTMHGAHHRPHPGRQEPGRTKPNPRYGGGLHSAHESYASSTTPSEMIGLVAALWASVAVAILPVLYMHVLYWLDNKSEWTLSMFAPESLLERVLVSFITIPVLIIFYGSIYFFFFGPFIVVITWSIKLLKLPRGIADVLGWMLIPPLFWAVLAFTGLIETTTYSPSWAESILFFGVLFMNGLGGLVYYLKQRQLHRALAP